MRPNPMHRPGDAHAGVGCDGCGMHELRGVRHMAGPRGLYVLQAGAMNLYTDSYGAWLIIIARM